MPDSGETASISVLQDGPEAGRPVVLAHGAGSGMDSAFMLHMASRIAASGASVTRFNFPYIDAGRRAPDKAPALEAAFEEVLAGIGSPMVIGGKSLGGRIAAHIAGRRTDIAGVFFLGYPLHPPGRPDRLRDAPLRKVDVPMLFVEGTRDPFCPLDTLTAVLKSCSAPHELVTIEDGDHSFKVRRSTGRDTEAAWDEAADAVVSWLRRI